MSKKTTLLMASPDYFSIQPPGENGFVNKKCEEGYKQYKKDPEGFAEIAIEQWHTLKYTIEPLAHVFAIETTKETFDGVFTADPSLSLVVDDQPITIISQFTNEERIPEIQLHEAFFAQEQVPEDLKPRIIHYSQYNMEGSGDNVYDAYRDTYWSGYTKNPKRSEADAGRTDIRAHPDLRAWMSTPTFQDRTVKPYFHIDTSRGVLPRGEVVVYPKGTKKFNYKKFNALVFEQYGLDPKTHFIEVSKQDAWDYACNFRVIGNTVVTPKCSDAFLDQIKRRGYDVKPVDLSHFILAGGSPHCLTNDIYERKIPGGYHAQENRHLMPGPGPT